MEEEGGKEAGGRGGRETAEMIEYDIYLYRHSNAL